ncbi:MAG: dephospho-CoA kinase, partial [Candidatus Nanopelagicales bacterium]
VIRPDGALDRPALAARVFGDPEALARLNAITHPRIAARTAEILASTSPEAIVVYDMPLLVEQGAEAIAGWDAVVVVDAPDDLRIRRLVARGVAEDDARRRMAAQAAREERLAIADFVLRNAEGEAELQAQVDSLWEALMARGT